MDEGTNSECPSLVQSFAEIDESPHNDGEQEGEDDVQNDEPEK